MSPNKFFVRELMVLSKLGLIRLYTKRKLEDYNIERKKIKLQIMQDYT